MRNALIMVGIGVIILAGGWWYLAHTNVATAQNPPTTTPVAKQHATAPEKQPVTENQGAAIGSENTVTFKCDNKKTMTAVFERDIVGLTLSDGRQVELRDVHLNAGSRYTSNDGKINLWDGWQDDIWLEENGTTTYTNCVASNQ